MATRCGLGSRVIGRQRNDPNAWGGSFPRCAAQHATRLHDSPHGERRTGTEPVPARYRPETVIAPGGAGAALGGAGRGGPGAGDAVGTGGAAPGRPGSGDPRGGTHRPSPSACGGTRVPCAHVRRRRPRGGVRGGRCRARGGRRRVPGAGRRAGGALQSVDERQRILSCPTGRALPHGSARRPWWCPEPDLNRHARSGAARFKLAVSAFHHPGRPWAPLRGSEPIGGPPPGSGGIG